MDSTKATVTLFLDQRRSKKNEKYPVKLVVYFEGKKERYATGHDLTLDEWERIAKSSLRDDDLKLVKRKLHVKKDKAEKVIESLEYFNFEGFEEHYLQEKKIQRSSLLKDAFEEYIELLNTQGRVGSAAGYKTTLNSLLAYKPDLLIKDITKNFLEGYEAYMRQKGHALTSSKLGEKAKQRLALKPSRIMSPTTIGIYLRHLRAILNRAIEAKLLPADKYPFKGYDIPSSRNVKKALAGPQIRKLLDYQAQNEEQRRALDFWLFSYISNGINFTDICNLRPEDLKGSFFTFHRAKTKNTKKRDKRPIKVPLTQETLAIIERWKSRDSTNPYLFPVLQPGLSPLQQKYKIQDFIFKVNQQMNAIAKDLGFDGRLGTYVARHSHSTILKRSGASTEFIKENLGHSSVLTTENYLDDFEDDVKMEYAKKLTDL